MDENLDTIIESEETNEPKETEETEEITVIIIDDDIPSAELLRDALATHPDVHLLGTYTTLAKGRKAIEELNPELVFLDIEFPDGSGLDLFENDKRYPGTHFIFYTLYSKYFHEAFRLRAFDYLLKPFDPDEVALILERYRLDDVLPGGYSEEIHSFFSDRAEIQPIAITTLTNEKIIVPPSSIIFFRYDSERKIWEAVLANLHRYILKRHTNADLILSYGPSFVRTHKSYIVNIHYLALITGNECRLLPPFNEITEIKISKSYRRQLLDRFYDI